MIPPRSRDSAETKLALQTTKIPKLGLLSPIIGLLTKVDKDMNILPSLGIELGFPRLNSATLINRPQVCLRVAIPQEPLPNIKFL